MILTGDCLCSILALKEIHHDVPGNSMSVVSWRADPISLGVLASAESTFGTLSVGIEPAAMRTRGRLVSSPVRRRRPDRCSLITARASSPVQFDLL